MKKGFAAIAAALLMLFSFSACTANKEITEKYVKIENGYALEQFKGASTQKTLTVKDEVDSIPVTALLKFSVANAEYLEELYLGKNIQTIDSWALTNCSRLKGIHVDPDNPYFASEDGVLFTKDRKTLIAYPNNSHGVTFEKSGAYRDFGRYEVPEAVEMIQDKAFYKCYGLGEIKLPEQLKTIGARAFTRCENLKAIDLPRALESIGEDAFSFCTSLTKVFIPRSVVKIDDYAFFGVNQVEKFEMERADASEMQLSEKWLPEKQKSGSLINEKTPVEWGVEGES